MSEVFFGGRQITTPGVYSALDESRMSNPNLSVGNVAALVGRAIGIEPFKAHRFGGADEARKVISDDITLKAIERAFDPSSETTGPSVLVFIAVNPSTQATAVVNDAAGNAAINLKATKYGRPGNQVKYKIEPASVEGKKLTTQLGNDYYSLDNVARNAMSVRYTGAEAAATITVADAVVTLAAGDATAELDLRDYLTVQELVDRINSTAGFNAVVLDGNSEKPTLQALDAKPATSCKNVDVVVTAHLQACVDWFNSTGEGFITAERAAGAGAPPANTPFAYLSGASDGEVTNAEWQKAFDVLQQEDVQWVAPLSPLAAIRSMCDTHCAFMSNSTKMMRRSYTGGGTGMTDAEAVEAAKSLNSDRTSFAHLGVYDFNQKGVLTLYPAYVAAAAMAGMSSGVSPGTSLTNKTMKFQGVERKLRIPTDTDFLLKGGVVPLADTPEGYKVIQSITTWRANRNFNRCEQGTGAGLDFTRRNVQEAVDGVVGQKGSPRWMIEAYNRAEAALKALAVPEPLGPGVLVGDAENPPYRALKVSLVADAIQISYEANVALTINYVLQTVSPTVFNSSVGG